jgi:hypothetical protein
MSDLIKRKLEIDSDWLCVPTGGADCVDDICRMDSRLSNEERKACAEHIVKSWNGYDWAVKRVQDLAKDKVKLLAACDSFLKGWLHFYNCIDFGKSNLDAEAIRFMNEVPGQIEQAHKTAVKPTQSTPEPAEPQSPS